jgi:hypothetical protein
MPHRVLSHITHRSVFLLSAFILLLRPDQTKSVQAVDIDVPVLRQSTTVVK